MFILRFLVVVIVLSRDAVPFTLKERCNRIAERRLPSMPDVQRTGRIRRNEFDDHAFAKMRIAAPEAIAKAKYMRDNRSPLGGSQPEIDEAGACDFDFFNDVGQRSAGRAGDRFRELPWILTGA